MAADWAFPVVGPVEITKLDIIVEIYFMKPLFGKRVVDKNVVVRRNEDSIHELMFHLQSFHKVAMEPGSVAKFGVQYFCYEKNQVLCHESKASAVRIAVPNVEMPECLFTHDCEVGQNQNFLKGRKNHVCDVGALHVQLEHLGKESC